MKGNKIKFTKKTVMDIPLSENRSIRYFDTETPYLILEVGKRTKTYKLYKKIKGKVKTVTLGKYPEYSVTEMREKAAKTFVALNEGKDPNEKVISIRSYALSFFKYTEQRFEKNQVSNSWYKTCQRYLNINKNQYPTLPDIALNKFSHGKANQYLNEVEIKHSPVVRDGMLKVLSAMLSRAYNEGHIKTSPFQTTKKIAINKRTRVLDVEEVTKLFEAAKTEELIYSHILTALILTGQRKMNVLSMKWEDLNLPAGIWKIPASNSKTKREIEVVLPTQMLTLLNTRRQIKTCNSIYVFPSKKKPTTHISEKTSKNSWWYRIRDKAGLHFPKDKEKNVQVHDLRRTYATIQLRNGTDISVVSKNLGHTNISITTSTYAHTDIGQRLDSAQSFADLITGNKLTSSINIDNMSQNEKDNLLRELLKNGQA